MIPMVCIVSYHVYVMLIKLFIDWRVAGNLTTGKESVGVFQNILANASALDTGFVTLAVPCHMILIVYPLDLSFSNTTFTKLQ